MKPLMILFFAATLVSCRFQFPGNSQVLAEPAGMREHSLHGKDLQGEACTVEVLSYAEERFSDLEQPSEDVQFTDVEKRMQVRVTFQDEAPAQFITKSMYSPMRDAFETNVLAGQNVVDGARREYAKLYLNHQNKIAAIDFQRDPVHAVLGVGLNATQNSCFLLR